MHDEAPGIPLTPDVLLSAYAQGIFPMEIDGRIRWLNPDPRAILELDDFRVSRSLRRVVRQARFEIRVDHAFETVVGACADRPEGTWINAELIAGYTRLHELGFAHSVEAYRQGELVGGLYGVALRGAFFGESMFHRVTDASKVALVHLVRRLQDRDYRLLDTQFLTRHLLQFGVREIPRDAYLRRLQAALRIAARFSD